MRRNQSAEAPTVNSVAEDPSVETAFYTTLFIFIFILLIPNNGYTVFVISFSESTTFLMRGQEQRVLFVPFN